MKPASHSIYSPTMFKEAHLHRITTHIFLKKIFECIKMHLSGINVVCQLHIAGK